MKYELTAKRIQDALYRNRMKAVDLSLATGINKASISQYVNGSHAPGNLSAGKMAKVLHVSPLWLMGFDVPMNEEVNEKVWELSKQMAADENISEVRNALLDFVQTLSEDQCQVVLQMLQSFLGKS